MNHLTDSPSTGQLNIGTYLTNKGILKLWLSLFILISSLSLLSAQVVINEILPNGTVELKNLGTGTVDVADYWLCDFPAYQQISQSNLDCGNMMMGPGEILVVNNFNTISGADGEMGLYTTNSFGSASAIIDYVEWGSSGHQRATVAEAAGIWMTGTFVPAFTGSLSWDGAGDAVSNWFEGELTICAENMQSMNCEAEGGQVSGGPFEFCVGDGVEDNVSGITLAGNSGGNSQWVVTDEQGNILGLPPMPGAVNFDGAGAGTCLIWHLSYENGLEGLAMELNTDNLSGCFDFSNPITVVRNQPAGGVIAGGPFEFCVGDGIEDNVSGIALTGNSGSNSQWIVTDEAGNILGLPPMPSVVNFDGAGGGTCLIWHLSYEDGLEGLAMEMNANDLVGCFNLSNSIAVVRNQPTGGELAGGPFEFCVGDGIEDNVSGITLAGNSGSNSQWVVTDEQGTILGLPPMPGVVNFDGAGAGTCLIWHLSYEDGLQGLAMDLNTNNLSGCYNFSNSIAVVRLSGSDCDPVCDAEGGELAGGPFEFCVGDGIEDNVSGITLMGNSGTNSQWVVTDEAGNILGLPPMPGVVNFDGAGAGTCLIWHLSYEDGLQGAEMGMNANDLEGCFDLSNPITVVRNQPDGGNLHALTGNVFNRVVIANRASGTISVINSDNDQVENTYAMPDDGEPMYVVYNQYTNSVLVGDYNGKVASFDGKTFEHLGSADAGAGVFHMWLSPDGRQLWVNNELDKTISVIDPNTMENIATIDLPADLLEAGYKPHDVIIMPNNEAAFVTVLGTGEADYVLKYSATTFMETARVAVGNDPHVSLTAANDKLYVASQGADELKVLNRSDLSEVTSLEIPNAHGLGMNQAGTYLYVGNISDGGIAATFTVDLATNMVIGEGVDAPFPAPHNYSVTADDSKLFITHSGATNDKVSIYELMPMPNLITSVTVGNNPFGLVAYTYVESNDALTICAGDGAGDAFDVSLEGAQGSNSAWIITDADLTILGMPLGPPFDLDGAGAGTCLIWHLSYEDGLTGATLGANAGNLEGCFDLSNPITVTRYEGETIGGELSTNDPTEICAGDGIPNPINVTLVGNVGTNSGWVITDTDLNILGMPMAPPFDLDGAGAGTCLIWHLSYEDGLLGATVGANAADLQGCYDLSNPITVVRSQPAGGELAGGPFEFCVGDGVEDNVSGITLTGNSGSNSQWVVTDENGNILGLPPMPGAVNFDGAGPGTCLIWHLSYEDGLEGLAMDLNANELTGCYSLSNPITVVRNQPAGGELAGGPFEFCVGDGIVDNVSGITLNGNSGSNSQWVVTDENGTILGLPPMPGVVDFDGAGAGTCLIWHLSYEDGLEGLAGELNTNDLVGCYSFSNPITVVRLSGADCNPGCDAEGGELAGGPFEFCVGDGVADNVSGITLAGNSGSNSQWVVTDEDGTILGLPPMPGVVNFDGAGPGTCLIWHLSYEDGLEGLAMDLNANNLVGCFDLSNPISVIRNQPAGGELAGGPFEFCVDGVADNVSGITLTGNSGSNSQWVVTDEAGTILGLPPMPGLVNFDNAGPGTCLIWNLSYEDGLEGLTVNFNTDDLMGCYSFSNPIVVVRNQPAGGELAGGPFEFCVGDGIEDNVSGITLTGNSGSNSQWVVTDEDGTILGLPPMPGVVNFDGAGPGTCLIWHLSYEDGLEGLAMELNANDLMGCYSLSNPISVVRLSGADCNPDCEADGGQLAGGPFEFCVGDGIEDNVSGITLTGNSGSNSQWVVTDEDGTILGLPPMPGVVNFDGAGPGTCLIWHLSFEDGLQGAEMGMNANDLEGCFDLSNPIAVVRNQPDGGQLAGGPFEFCVGDGIEDNVSGITLTGNSGSNSQWVVTDEDGTILGLPPMPGAVNFDGAGPGTCLIWHLSFEDGLQGTEMGMNANDLEGCYSLSNPITVVRLTGADCNAGGVDLAMSISVDDGLYDQYEEVSYSITVRNDGDATATGVVVSAGLPDGMVFTSADESQGDYELFFEEWYVGELGAGASATLELVLFTLIEDVNITNFVQVVAQDQTDADSTPDSNNGNEPEEDDEAAITIKPRAGGGVGTGDGSIDLALTITSEQSTYDQYEEVAYTITLSNDGEDTANNIIISAGLPEGMVFTSANTSAGDYSLFFEQWNIEELEAGESVTLDLVLFTLVDNVAITNFVEVFTAGETDTDSTPGNGNGVSPQEDDEAAWTVEFLEGTNAPFQQSEVVAKTGTHSLGVQVYPNPAILNTTLAIRQDVASDATVTVTDISGKIQIQRSLYLERGANTLDLEIGDLMPGNYFIQVNSELGMQSNHRFVKI